MDNCRGGNRLHCNCMNYVEGHLRERTLAIKCRPNPKFDTCETIINHHPNLEIVCLAAKLC